MCDFALFHGYSSVPFAGFRTFESLMMMKGVILMSVVILMCGIPPIAVMIVLHNNINNSKQNLKTLL